MGDGMDEQREQQCSATVQGGVSLSFARGRDTCVPLLFLEIDEFTGSVSIEVCLFTGVRIGSGGGINSR